MYIIISIDAENYLQIIQQPFIIKTLGKLGIEENLLSLMKSFYEKPIANVMLNSERQCFLFKIDQLFIAAFLRAFQLCLAPGLGLIFRLAVTVLTSIQEKSRANKLFLPGILASENCLAHFPFHLIDPSCIPIPGLFRMAEKFHQWLAY